jgi:hypothetical protein
VINELRLLNGPVALTVTTARSVNQTRTGLDLNTWRRDGVANEVAKNHAGGTAITVG